MKSPFKIPTVKLTKLPEKLNTDKGKNCDNKNGTEDEIDDLDHGSTDCGVYKG